MATYKKMEYLLPPVPIHLKLLLNSDIGFIGIQMLFKSLTVAGIEQGMLQFLVLFILRLRDILWVPINHVPTESRELRIVEATEMVVI